MKKNIDLRLGNCLDVMKTMEDNSISSIVCDPPYGLSNHKPEEVIECLRAWINGEVYTPKGKGFMNKEWDAWVPGPEIWKEALRVLKPGGYLLAFAGTRSMDLMSMSIRIAGFELRDNIGYASSGDAAPLLAWVYGSGFPKSLDISKNIDSMAGVEREVIGTKQNTYDGSVRNPENHGNPADQSNIGKWGLTQTPHGMPLTAPMTDAAKKYSGFGTNLKPAFEPIIMARKPLSESTIVANVLKHGTGGINIDGCRVSVSATDDIFAKNPNTKGGFGHGNAAVYGNSNGAESYDPTKGRFPANFIHDGSDEVVSLFPDSKSCSSPSKAKPEGTIFGGSRTQGAIYPGEDGNASRFFYCAKANQKDRNEGLEDFEGVKFLFSESTGLKNNGDGTLRNDSKDSKNSHPTVKPTELMKYLVRLVTPPNGTVLDPFMGSGSTGKAAVLEGFNFVGIDMEQNYLDISKARIEHAMLQSGNDTNFIVDSVEVPIIKISDKNTLEEFWQ